MTPVEPPASEWLLPLPGAAEPGSDVVAIGADLAPATVLAAYRAGLFPMHLQTGELAWWSPDPRGVLPCDGFRLSRSLRRSLRSLTVTIDTSFVEVMRGCADARREGSWITEGFIDTYTELHRLGWAHSVEVWTPGGELAGGLYGIEVGGLFAGESMFHSVRDASKVALAALVRRLTDAGGERMLDVQWCTPHLASLGAVEVSRSWYLTRLAEVLSTRPAFTT